VNEIHHLEVEKVQLPSPIGYHRADFAVEEGGHRGENWEIRERMRWSLRESETAVVVEVRCAKGMESGDFRVPQRTLESVDLVGDFVKMYRQAQQTHWAVGEERNRNRRPLIRKVKYRQG
jgi:hypothetical protein